MTTLDSSREPSPCELRVRSHEGSVTEVRRRMAEYAEAGGANRQDVELAVAEAVSNAVVHGFKGTDDGVIIVRARIEGVDWLVIEVVDFGSGITATGRGFRAGFGLPIIGALADRVEMRTGRGGTRLVLRFPRRPRSARRPACTVSQLAPGKGAPGLTF
jgi:anti-sigma regulatory factor (Ser/Thr protein kinase)